MDPKGALTGIYNKYFPKTKAAEAKPPEETAPGKAVTKGSGFLGKAGNAVVENKKATEKAAKELDAQ